MIDKNMLENDETLQRNYSKRICSYWLIGYNKTFSDVCKHFHISEDMLSFILKNYIYKYYPLPYKLIIDRVNFSR